MDDKKFRILTSKIVDEKVKIISLEIIDKKVKIWTFEIVFKKFEISQSISKIENISSFLSMIKW